MCVEINIFGYSMNTMSDLPFNHSSDDAISSNRQNKVSSEESLKHPFHFICIE
jgi:hypothetical protein